MGIFKSIKEVFTGPDPKELVRKWQREMRTEERRIEREIRQIQMEQKKKEGDLRAVAKRGDQASMLILTKALVQSRGTVNRLYTSKANLISMQTHLQAQLATLKVSKTLSASTEVLSVVNTLIRIPEMREATKRLSKEMYKAGILGEMVEDTFEDMGDDVSMEAEEEVQKVLMEVAGDVLEKLPGGVPRSQKEAMTKEEAEVAAAAKLLGAEA